MIRSLKLIILGLIITFFGCSKSSFKDLDIDSLKEKSIKKHEDLKNLKEKIDKVKKKI